MGEKNEGQLKKSGEEEEVPEKTIEISPKECQLQTFLFPEQFLCFNQSRSTRSISRKGLGELSLE